MKKIYWAGAVFLLAFIVRLTFVLCVPISPVSDFALYFEMAKSMAGGVPYAQGYIALFPHTITFPFILSIFFRIFGSSILKAQMVGVIFSSLCASLIFLIGLEVADASCKTRLFERIFPKLRYSSIEGDSPLNRHALPDEKHPRKYRTVFN